MSFQDMTAFYQAQIDEYRNNQISDDTMVEIQEILADYCNEVEITYGVAMTFKVWYDEGEKRLRYRVDPDSELDDILLKHVVQNAAGLGNVTMTIQ